MAGDSKAVWAIFFTFIQGQKYGYIEALLPQESTWRDCSLLGTVTIRAPGSMMDKNFWIEPKPGVLNL